MIDPFDSDYDDEYLIDVAGLAIMIAAGLAAVIGLLVMAVLITPLGPDSTVAPGSDDDRIVGVQSETPTPTITQRQTNAVEPSPDPDDCQVTPNDVGADCVDSDGDGEFYKCVDNVDCGDDTPPTAAPTP